MHQMYPVPPNEHLVEIKTCRQCSTPFPITDKDMEFYEKMSPVFGGKKYQIPTPTLCPDCRQQRRLSFRNERKLYKRKCDVTGRDIISIYSPGKPYIVYHPDYWWSDAWDPLDYGRVFDFSRSFFEQFREMIWEVPRPALFQRESENSEYTQTCTNNKNSFMLFESSFNQYCSYSYWIHHSSDCVDCSFCDLCDRCFDCIDCSDNSELIWCQNCTWCKESYFLKNCIGCTSCFGSMNLTNAQFVFFDTQLSQDQYEKMVVSFLLTKQEYQNWSKECNIFHETHIQRFSQIWESEDCTWDYIRNAKNCHNCFYVFAWAENIKYTCNTGMIAEYIMDGDAIGANAGYIYESINTALVSYRTMFSIRSWASQDSIFLNECDNCSTCFACIGLRNKSYCILNKQYTCEEYEELVPRIIEHMMKTGEWGEFFPASLSPFGYNETVAQEYFPLSRKEVLGEVPSEVSGLYSPLTKGDVTKWQGNLDSRKWAGQNPPSPPGSSPGQALWQGGNEAFLHWPIFNWSDYESPFPTVEKIIPGSKLPDSIESIPDDILNWAIECEVTKKPFRIINQELEFYRKHNLPIPRRHPDQRHLDRMALRNPRKLYERVCDCENCEENHKQRGVLKEEEFDMNTRTGKRAKKMITTYAPERTEMVYCEECYNREVVG